MADSNEEYVIDIMVNAIDNAKTTLANAQSEVTKFQDAAKQTEQRIQQMSRTPFDLTIRGIDKATSVIDRVTNKASDMTKRSYEAVLKVRDLATAPIRGVMNLLGSYQAMMVGMAATAATGAAIAWPIKLADNLTQANISFQTMLGSASKANAFMKQVQNFAAATPYSTQQVVGDAQYLLSQGWKQNQVIPVLNTVGNSISASGGNLNDITNVLMALSQMRANGRVDAQDMDQLINANLPAWQILAQSRGQTVAQVRNASQNGQIASGPAVQAILAGLEKRYGGAMDKNANLTVGGILSQIGSVFSTDVATPWGQGLQKGLLPELQKFNDFLTTNQQTVDRWGADLEHWGQAGAQWFTGKINDTITALDKMTQSQAWQNANGFWGKVNVGWDDLIVKPFDQWWSSSGQQEIKKISGDIGGGIGSFMHDSISAALGLVGGGNGSGFTSAGQTAGTQFFNAFLKAFDAKDLASKAESAFKNIQPWNQSSTTGKIAGTALDLGALALLLKGYKGGKSVVTNATDAAKGLNGLLGVGKATETSKSDSAAVRALSKTTGVLSKSKGLGILSLLTGVLGVMTAKTAQGKGSAAGGALGGWGGAAGGAEALGAVGTAVLPGIGTAIGGLLGGILGGLFGNWAGRKAGSAVGSTFAQNNSSKTLKSSSATALSPTANASLYQGVTIPSLNVKPSKVSATQTPQVKQSNQIHVTNQSTYHIKSDTPEQVMGIINSHQNELADSLANTIAQKLEHTHANMPTPPPKNK